LILRPYGALAAMGDSDSGSPTATSDNGATVPASVSGSDEAGAYFEQAKAAIRQERFDDAIVALQQILKRRPDDADALNLMGYSQRRTGRRWRGTLTISGPMNISASCTSH
jgi:Flp pilus assembly protein TadD